MRMSLGVVTADLIRIFHINATQIGILSALFYYAYACMQIPAGILLDRFGVRKLILISCFISVLGTLLFASTDQYGIAAIARLVMGFGGAFAFLGALVVAKLWLPPERIALASGLLGTLGFLGAIGGENFLVRLNEKIGYHMSFVSLAGFGFIIFLLIVITTQKIKISQNLVDFQPDFHIDIKEALKKVFQNKCVIIASLLAGLLYLPSSVIAELWGIPFIQQIYHIPKTEAVFSVTCIFAGWVVGSTLLGALAMKIRMTHLIMVASFFNLGILLFVIFIRLPSVGILEGLLFLFGVFSGAQLLAYPLIARVTPMPLTSTAMGLSNMCTVLAPVIGQPLVGLILDAYSHPKTLGAAVMYSDSAYRIAFSFLPLTCLLVIVLAILFKRLDSSNTL